MAKFRQIHTSFWQDPFVLDLTPEEKYFYLYLLSNSKTTQCGIYELPKRVIELETGYNRETVDKLLQRFTDYKKILYSDATKEIYILNWCKYNYINSPTVLSHIQKETEKIKNREFAVHFCATWKQRGLPSIVASTKANAVPRQSPPHMDTLPIPYPASQDTLSIPYPDLQDTVLIGWGGKIEENRKIKEENKAQSPPSKTDGNTLTADAVDGRGKAQSGEGLTVSKTAGTAAGSEAREQPPTTLVEKRFAEFWAYYPKKVGKKAAEAIWKKIRPTDALHAQIITAVLAAKNTDQWTRENGRFIPNPATWLTQGRWDDEHGYYKQPEGGDLVSAAFVPSSGFRTRLP